MRSRGAQHHCSDVTEAVPETISSRVDVFPPPILTADQTLATRRYGGAGSTLNSYNVRTVLGKED